jgi:hypothetical protein
MLVLLPGDGGQPLKHVVEIAVSLYTVCISHCTE